MAVDEWCRYVDYCKCCHYLCSCCRGGLDWLNVIVWLICVLKFLKYVVHTLSTRHVSLHVAEVVTTGKGLLFLMLPFSVCVCGLTYFSLLPNLDF